MKLVFIGTTAVHHALVAAHLYLNNAKTIEDVYALDGYCDTSLDRTGYPVYVGKDRHENKIYTLGLGSQLEVGIKAIKTFLEAMQPQSSEIQIQPIRISEEFLLFYLTKLDGLPGFYLLHQKLATRILNKNMDVIASQILG